MSDVKSLRNHPLWWRALAHLEEQNPVKLEQLLNNQRLKSYLDDAVSRASDAVDKIQESNPNLTVEEATERVVPDLIAPEVKDYDAANPLKLNHELKRRLKAFKKKIEAEIM